MAPSGTPCPDDMTWLSAIRAKRIASARRAIDAHGQCGQCVQPLPGGCCGDAYALPTIRRLDDLARCMMIYSRDLRTILVASVPTNEMLKPQDAVQGISNEIIELRSRNARNNGENRGRSERIKGIEKVIIEKKLKPGDNLNKIALQYSVSVSDLKRANNIVSEQDIYALPLIKIPVSKLRKELNLEHERHLLMEDGHSQSVTEQMADDRPLLGNGDSSDKSVEELFEKADASIAQVRNNLPSDSVDGSFHFVDASSPDTTFRGLWFVLVFVVFVFIFVPLILTFVEEEQTESHGAKKIFPKN